MFEEHLTAVESNTSMAWDFVFNAPETLVAFDPTLPPRWYCEHAIGVIPPYITAKRRYLIDLGNKLFNQDASEHISCHLGEVFLQDFHHAVLSVIKTRSEKG